MVSLYHNFGGPCRIIVCSQERRNLEFIYRSTYIHTYIYTYIHVYILTYVHTYIHTYKHTYTHIHTYIYTYIHTYLHTYTHIHTYIHTYIQSVKTKVGQYTPVGRVTVITHAKPQYEVHISGVSCLSLQSNPVRAAVSSYSL